MTVIKVLPTGQLTLPDDLRRRLQLGEGTYLEAVEVEGGILLRPLANAAARGWQRVLSVVEQDKWASNEPRPDPGQEEEQIADLIAAFRGDA